ncbi:hypothetical protein [Candidimonas nitroreducens]|nr:hypothetical protein [Candidimonas nitroreducens]
MPASVLVPLLALAPVQLVVSRSVLMLVLVLVLVRVRAPVPVQQMVSV